MQCFGCGQVTKIGINKLCDSCTKKLEAKNSTGNISKSINTRKALDFAPKQSSFFKDNFFIVMLILGGITFMGYSSGVLNTAAPVSFEDGYVKVQQKHGKLVYSVIGKDRIQGHLILWNYHSGAAKNGGIAGMAAVLSPAQYNDYNNHYGPGKGCAASFLNANAENLNFISDDALLYNFVRKHNFSEGAKIDISGDLLKATHIEENGEMHLLGTPIVRGKGNMPLTLRPAIIYIDDQEVYKKS
jgi:hypothetical protein